MHVGHKTKKAASTGEIMVPHPCQINNTPNEELNSELRRYLASSAYIIIAKDNIVKRRLLVDVLLLFYSRMGSLFEF